MLRPKILRPKYSFYITIRQGLCKLAVTARDRCEKAVTARSDHSLQHSYSFFRNKGRTTTLLGVATETSVTSVGCNNHHSVWTHDSPNRNRALPALTYNPSNKCAMRVFPRSQERPAPAISAEYAHRVNYSSFVTQHIAFVNNIYLYLVLFRSFELYSEYTDILPR